MKINDDLWDVFTNYALIGDKTDPDHLDETQFHRLCEDADISVQHHKHVGMKYKGHLSVADVRMVYAQYTSKNEANKMSYGTFVTSLVSLAVRWNANNAETRTKADDKLSDQELEAACRVVIVEKILPNCHRRSDLNISGIINSEKVTVLRSIYENSLQEIFSCYADLYDKRAKQSGIFVAGSSKRIVGFNELYQFIVDIGLITFNAVSRYDIAKIYHASVPSPGKSRTTGLKFDHFWEAIVRIALVNFSAYQHAEDDNKICGLFLYIWQTMQKHQITLGRGDAKHQAYLPFLNQFYTIWSKYDNFKDYVARPQDEGIQGNEKATELLGTLLGGTSMSKR